MVGSLRRFAILKILAREGFSEKVTFEKRPKNNEALCYVNVQGNSNADIVSSSQ